MQLTFVVAILAAFLPLAAATYYQQPQKNSCKSSEFWCVYCTLSRCFRAYIHRWSDKKCCLPTGGIKTPPSPPKGTNCPPTNWYWNTGKGCCTPRNPPLPSNPPPPQCPKNWTWQPSTWRCVPIPTPPTTPAPNPSPKPGDKDCDDKGNPIKGGSKFGGHKRALKARLTSLCPTDLDACPVSSLSGADYECVDYATEIEFCGGCPSLGKGQDCTKIEGAWNVGCDQGTCTGKPLCSFVHVVLSLMHLLVLSCAGGFRRSEDGKSCIPL